MRNFQLLGQQNVIPLLHQIALHLELWNQNRIRTGHEQSPHSVCDDILLRFQHIHSRDEWDQNYQRVAGEASGAAGLDSVEHAECVINYALESGLVKRADASIVDDPECVWYPAWDVLTEAHNLIFDLSRVVKAERIGRIIISRLPPGKTITPHEDGGAVATYYTRYQMPLQSGPGCIFECEGEKVQMSGGEVWWFDNKRNHAVYNNSNTDRLAMIVDMRTR